MDISSYYAKDSITIDLVDPKSGEMSVASITLMTRESKAAREIESKLEQEDTEARAIERLAYMTLSWDGLEDGGKKLVCSREAAESLYTKVPDLAIGLYRKINEKLDFM